MRVVASAASEIFAVFGSRLGGPHAALLHPFNRSRGLGLLEASAQRLKLRFDIGWGGVAMRVSEARAWPHSTR
jgi:hypothetical protein